MSSEAVALQKQDYKVADICRVLWPCAKNLARKNRLTAYG
jgi:hypothetical protein